MKTTQILIAGFGGQGVLFAGKFLAYKGLVQDKNVSWLPSPALSLSKPMSVRVFATLQFTKQKTAQFCLPTARAVLKMGVRSTV